MLLDVNGWPFTAHFAHLRDGKGKKERWHTSCIFHAGKCTNRECTIQLATGNLDSFATNGVATCNPGDQFSKSQGRIAALTKALKAYRGSSTAPREFRAQVWAAYFKISPHR